jgi:probable HAF family extracellular repeat protein
LEDLICLPFVWQNGMNTALPTPGGNNATGGGINNKGQKVGQSETSKSDPCSLAFLQVEAAIWEDGQVRELPPLPGDADGGASAINDSGRAVGLSGCISGAIHAVLWQHDTPIDLGNLGGVTGNIASSTTEVKWWASPTCQVTQPITHSSGLRTPGTRTSARFRESQEPRERE